MFIPCIYFVCLQTCCDVTHLRTLRVVEEQSKREVGDDASL